MNNAINIFLTKLRNKKTSRADFRQAAHALSAMLAYETALHVKTQKCSIETPIQRAEGTCLETPILIIPILRSGITMLPAFLDVFTDAVVGVVGLKRDEKTAIAHLYYQNIPAITANTQIIIIDPMLATGGTSCDTVQLLLEKGANPDAIIFTSIVSSPEGVDVLQTTYPKVKLITASVDEKLNDKKYIVPGLGDFGDRYFGTE